MSKPLPPYNYHTDFSVCLQCKPCGGDCTFFDNSVVFIRNRRTRRVERLKFDTSLAACNGECGYHCVTNFKLTEAIKE